MADNLETRIGELEKKFDAHEKHFAKFEGGNEQRQKNIEGKLETLIEAQKDGTKHDSAQQALVSDLNNEIQNILKPMSESFTRYKERLGELEGEVRDMKTEKRMMNKFWGVAVTAGLILSPIISQWVARLLGWN